MVTNQLSAQKQYKSLLDVGSRDNFTRDYEGKRVSHATDEVELTHAARNLARFRGFEGAAAQNSAAGKVKHKTMAIIDDSTMLNEHSAPNLFSLINN